MSTTATVATLKSDLRYINPFVQSGITETLTQAAAGLFEASRGALLLSAAQKPGDFETMAFFQNIANLISRRDPTSLATANDLKLLQSEFSRVKINRKIGPVASTRDAFRKAGLSREAMDLVVGQQAGVAMQVDMVNTTLRSLRAALVNDAACYVDGGAATINTAGNNGLIDALARRGDAASAIVCWVMHSKVFFNLVKEQIATNIDGVSGLVFASGSPLTLGRPVLVTDSPDLVVANGISAGVDAYFTLGLTPGAAIMEETEGTEVVTQDVTGQENLIMRIQGEYAQNVGLKGYTWDRTNGGENPTNAALATGTNWDPSFADMKDRAGVVLRTR